MSRYCLDSVAYSHFKRREPRIAALLDSAEWVGIPVTVHGELFPAFERPSGGSPSRGPADRGDLRRDGGRTARDRQADSH